MRPVLAIAGGWLLWAAAFASIYALHGWGCANGFDQRGVGPLTLLQLIIGSVWFCAIAAALVALRVRAAAHLPGDVPRRLVAAGWIASLAAIVLTGLPITFTGGCT
jgi:hypothetical protein